MHKNDLAQINIFVWCMAGGGGVARVFRAQSAAQVSVLSLEKISKNVETHAHCKTMFQKQGQADLQPFRHDEEFILCRIRHRIRYHILCIVYDIVCIHDVVNDVLCNIMTVQSLFRHLTVSNRK